MPGEPDVIFDFIIIFLNQDAVKSRPIYFFLKGRGGRGHNWKLQSCVSLEKHGLDAVLL